MSEPVAWLSDDGRVITAESKLSLPKSLANFRIPLYSADEIERKDAVIAELLEILKDCSESLGSFCSDEGWGQIDMDRMDSADAAIAKYDRAES